MLEKFYNRCRSEKFRQLISVAPNELCFRILSSVVPPVTTKYKRVCVDFLGPLFAVILLIIVLNYGNASDTTVLQVSSFEIVVLYVILMPVLCFTLNKIGQSRLSFFEIFSINGYSLYGHVVTLAISLFRWEGSNALFFLSMIVFGGLSTIRLVLLQIQAIPIPGARLLICSVVSVIHILFLIMLHFTYMHPDFVYGTNQENG